MKKNIIKKILCIAITFIMLLFFLLAPDLALEASQRGLLLWFHQLLPTLLPFSILSYVILHSNLFASMTARKTSSAIRPEEWYIILCGFLFGFPIGSKLTADLYKNGRLSREKASILFVFTNNLSPIFVTTAWKEQLGKSPHISTYFLLYGIPFIFGIVQMCRIPLCMEHTVRQKNAASRFQLNMQIIDAGIVNGFETLIKICGYIILFSLSAEMLKLIPLEVPLLKTALIGCMEVTNGMATLGAAILPEQMRCLLAVLFLSWGGICGFFQTASIVSSTDLSMKDYLVKRLVLVGITCVSAILLCALGIG